jgi:DNA-binding NarL/FixJ family response regulator
MQEGRVLKNRRVVSCAQVIGFGHRSHSTIADARPRLIVIERIAFLCECLVRSLKDDRFAEVVGFANVSDAVAAPAAGESTLVLLSALSATEAEAEAALAMLRKAAPDFRIMLLASSDDPQSASAAIEGGANGYITTSVGFETLPLALQFIGGGGMYVPAQCLVAAGRSSSAAPETALENDLTSREEAVVKGIQQGKPNKVIAYELNMCESTVKVHVRHIMRKLRARNRTEVAIKAGARDKAPFGAGFTAMRDTATP